MWKTNGLGLWIKKGDCILVSEVVPLSTSEAQFQLLCVVWYLSSLGCKLSVFGLHVSLSTLFGVSKHLDIPRACPLEKVLY